MHNMAVIEKAVVRFPVVCHLEARELTLDGSTLFFHLFTLFSYIKKIVNLANMLGCRAAALPGTKQILPH